MAGPVQGNEARAAHRSSLISPLADFFLLGGSSLIVLPFLILFVPTDAAKPAVAATMLVLANFINHPHFAHSYQIFYRGFLQKLLDETQYSRSLRLRYATAGILVPLGIASYFAYSVLTDNPDLLAYGVNAMGFFVGWHYVKQGYGMLMVDCALKRRFFSANEKTLLRINAYSCWIFSWVVANREFREHDFWGLSYFTLDAPAWAYAATGMAALLSSGVTLLKVGHRLQGWRTSLPVNGLVAYAVTLYLWIVFVSTNPLFLLIVPALHSLQYLAVVWRYQFNRDSATAATNVKPGTSSPSTSMRYLRFCLFLALGYAGGLYGFYVLPEFLDTHIAYEPIFGQTLFMFLFWIFINIHHYFIDNVIWRADNPDTKTYLFASR